MPLVVLLTVAGVQVPVNPLSDRLGNVGAGSPVQMLAAFPKVNSGGVRSNTVWV